MLNSTSIRDPVLVVGAGPTGLAAALDLARFQVPVRLIDKLPAPLEHSRAIAIQPRTLEMLAQRGCVEALLELGHKSHAANFYSGNRQLLHLDFRPLLSPFPYVLFLDQTKTERVMRDRLEQLGVHVEHGVELVDFVDTDERVDAMLSKADGSQERTSVPYLIGCDGAHSLVRERLNLGFEGRTYPQTFALADLHVEWDRTDDEFHIFASDDGLIAIFPLGNQTHRLVADFFGEPSHDQPSLEECQSILNRRLNEPPRISDLTWSSYFHVNSRRVKRLKSDRVFVAGDAAHIHSPAAGQGMNTGIQESFNLAWKLALVMRGEAGAALLETYDEERRPIERDVLTATDVVINIVGARKGLASFFRDHIAPYVTGMELTQGVARRFVTEVDVNYKSSSLTFNRAVDGGVLAGERAPDAALDVLIGQANARRSRVFDLLAEPEFELLMLVDPEMADSAIVNEAANTIARGLGARVNTWQVKESGVGREGGSLTDFYGHVRPSFYLIRPDGYVMARGDLNSAEAAAAFCRSRFAGTTTV